MTVRRAVELVSGASIDPPIFLSNLRSTDKFEVISPQKKTDLK